MIVLYNYIIRFHNQNLYKGVVLKNLMVSWSPSDEKFLQKNYLTMDMLDIVKKLKRSKQTIQAKARELGLYKSKKKQAELYPDTSMKINRFWKDYVAKLETSSNILQKAIEMLMEQIESNNFITDKHVTALAKAVEAHNKTVQNAMSYLGIVEKNNTKIENVTINMNIYGLIQAANEVMDSNQKVRFMKNLKEKGIIEEILVP